MDTYRTAKFDRSPNNLRRGMVLMDRWPEKKEKKNKKSKNSRSAFACRSNYACQPKPWPKAQLQEARCVSEFPP